MYLIRSTETGWVNSYWTPTTSSYSLISKEASVMEGPLLFEITAAVAFHGTPEGYETIKLDMSVEEFEAAAREDAGLSEDSPLGDVYLKDEGVAFGVGKAEDPGKRIGQKRVKAYPPDTSTVAERLAEEYGAKGNHNVTYAALSEWERRTNNV